MFVVVGGGGGGAQHGFSIMSVLNEYGQKGPEHEGTLLLLLTIRTMTSSP